MADRIEGHEIIERPTDGVVFDRLDRTREFRERLAQRLNAVAHGYTGPDFDFPDDRVEDPETVAAFYRFGTALRNALDAVLGPVDDTEAP